jgi:ABC-type glycerol-3-phosphate transport system permease component
MINLFLLCGLIVVSLAVLGRFFRVWKKISLYAVLAALAVIMIVPFYMMFVMSTLSTDEIYRFPPLAWFGNNLRVNFQNMNSMVNLPRAFYNSTVIAAANTVLVLLFCSMGGYAFAVYDFPFKKQLFGTMLVTMMIPWTAGIIPWFIMMSKFGWINDFKALIIPGAANAFGIFWMRQYCIRNVPFELLDAARIDGCSEWTLFFRIVTPIILPAYASLGIMQFVNVWNNFMQPLMILRRIQYQTLPLLLRTMVGDRTIDYGSLMLASTCTALPLLVIFLLASKYFMSGLTAGAMKE